MHVITESDNVVGELLKMLKSSQTVFIGDVQGCAASLNLLLEICGERFGTFQICFVGDLINRGTGSLAVLERVRAGGYQTVLGNHEIYFLAVAAGAMRRKRDTLDQLFDSPSFMAWVDWVRNQPILLQIGGHTIVHAGVDPGWTSASMLAYAQRLEDGLRSPQWQQFLKGIVGEKIRDPELALALQTFTRMRMLRSDGQLDARYKGTPEDAPVGVSPWYSAYEGHMGPIIFGHWAALGARQLKHCISLDSGCVWGRALTAYVLPAGKLVSCEAVSADLSRER
jgi:bis(5'-nucleosyl)-tetraphosphatase (symmetrical)